MEEIIELSKKLISIKSTKDNRSALDECLTLCVSKLRGFTIERFEKDGTKSVLVYASKKRPEKFKIILNGHLDVIPGKDKQYDPMVVGNKLYGVGAMDMKASVACLIEIFKEVAKKVKYPLGLQLVTDEEIGGFNGTAYQIEKGVLSDFVIAGESTGLKINNSSKGILWVKISAFGKTAHGAYPWRGENAVWKMNQFLTVLRKKHPNPSKESWATTINLSKIETRNVSFNKIPDDCTIGLDIRFVPEESKKIVASIKKILPLGFCMEIIEQEPAVLVKENNRFIRLLKLVGNQITGKKIVLYGSQGSSDIRHFCKKNCEGVCFGPIGGGIGSDNEWVDIPSLKINNDILKKFFLKV